MRRRGRDYSWLPDHQLHVAATLGHADSLIAHVGNLLYDYLKPPGPLELNDIAEGSVIRTTVTAVAPLPVAVARYTADALTQLRAAIEHTIYAEVEFQSGRSLTENEARRIEMPATVSADLFERWLTSRVRLSLPPLHEKAQLIGRIRRLQPYHRRNPDDHPMRILAEHTNHAKHRAPAVAATLLGAVIPDNVRAPGLEIVEPEEDRPICPGDVLASAPAGVVVPLSIWPKVSVRRPHSGAWHVLMHELGDLEWWVRAVAIPILIVGTHQVDPLPPQLDTRTGHSDIRAALLSAGQLSAAKRAGKRIEAGTAREGLVETLARHPQHVSPQRIQDWVNTLDDDDVLAKMNRLSVLTGVRDLRDLDSVVRELLAQVLEIRPSKGS
jgi:hypothetical protein